MTKDDARRALPYKVGDYGGYLYNEKLNNSEILVKLAFPRRHQKSDISISIFRM